MEERERFHLLECYFSVEQSTVRRDEANDSDDIPRTDGKCTTNSFQCDALLELLVESHLDLGLNCLLGQRNSSIFSWTLIKSL